MNNKSTHGGVAQLGEHLPCKQGVRGSNPLISIRSQIFVIVMPKDPSNDRSSRKRQKNQNFFGLV